jgi:hypothetical protein
MGDGRWEMGDGSSEMGVRSSEFGDGSSEFGGYLLPNPIPYSLSPNSYSLISIKW